MPLSNLAGLPSALVLLVAFYGLGLGLLRLLKVRVVAFDGIYAVAAGWGTLVVLSILASFLGIPLSVILCGGLIAGVALAAVSILRWNEGSLGLIGVGLVAVLPAILWTTSFPSVQFDEFGHWLPNAFYLYANDALPTAALPNLQTGKQAYPIAIPYVTFAISVIEGTWDDRTGKVLPLLLAALFAVVLAGVFTRTERPTLAATAVATLFATLLNPFFDPRFAITTYSDIPTAFLLAVMVYALWRALEATEEGRGWLIRATLTAVTLIQLRQTNIVLVVAAALSLPLASLAAPPPDGVRAGLRRAGATMLVFVLAPLAVFGLWQLHLMVQGIGLDKLPRALAEWNWWGPGTALASLLTGRLTNNPLSGALAMVLMLGVAVAGAMSWRRSADASKRLLVSVATVTVAQVALLIFSYVAIFSAEGLGRAASAWRYASHLGPLYMLAAAQLVPWERAALWRKRRLASIPLPLASCLVIGSVVAAQVLFAGRWRIDCVYPHARPGYEALVSLFARVPSDASVSVVNGADSRLIVAASPLARVVATGDWRTPRATVVNEGADVPSSPYVIDLTAADPELFRQGQTNLQASLHRERLASPPIATVTVATTCPGAKNGR